MATKLVNGVRLEMTADDLADQAAQAADARASAAVREGKRAARVAAFEDVPANVNSVPALREKINEILAILRDE